MNEQVRAQLFYLREFAFRKIARLLRRGDREQGQTMTEYALIVALVAVAAVTAWAALGQKILALLQDVTNYLSPGGSST